MLRFQSKRAAFEWLAEISPLFGANGIRVTAVARQQLERMVHRDENVRRSGEQPGPQARAAEDLAED